MRKRLCGQKVHNEVSNYVQDGGNGEGEQEESLLENKRKWAEGFKHCFLFSL